MSAVLGALVNGIVVSAGLAFVVRIALCLIPPGSLNAATRYAIWWAVLALTVALPFQQYQARHRNYGGELSSPALASGFVLPDASPSPQVQRNNSSTSQNLPVTNRPTAHSLSGTPVPHPRFVIGLSPGVWPERVLIVWAAIACLMLLRLLTSIVLLERRKRHASAAPPFLAARVTAWTASCGGSGRRIALASAGDISVPLATGPWRPTILFPERLLKDFNEAELDRIGIHETAHLIRHDDYALLLQRLAEALFVLHPVVGWVSQHIELEREIACDDFVLSATGDGGVYASCLARVVELSGGVRAMPVAVAAVEGRSHLARRVEMLFDTARHTGTRLLGARLAAAGLCLAALAWGAAQTPEFIFFKPLALVESTPGAHRPRLLEHLQVAQTAGAPSLPEPPLMAQANRPVAPAVAPVPPAPPAPPAPPETAPAGEDSGTVIVPVDVRDSQGRFVTGLEPGVFQLREDGIEQVITQLAGSEDRADVFVLVAPELASDPALQPFLDERVRVASGTNVVQVHGFGQLSPQTSPLDALEAIQRRLSGISYRQAAIILTSSAATGSAPTQSESEKALAGIAMPVYVLDMAGTEPTLRASTSPLPTSVFLTELANRTGGDYIAVKRTEELPDLLSKVVIAVRNRYYLAYTPRNTARDGSYRKLQVTLEVPRGLPSLTAHFPPGYTANAR